jgi:hypothetical protein
MGGRLTKLDIWGDAILLLQLAGLEDGREIERTTPGGVMVGNLGLEETGGVRPCPRGRRAIGVQMDGEHWHGQQVTMEGRCLAQHQRDCGRNEKESTGSEGDSRPPPPPIHRFRFHRPSKFTGIAVHLHWGWAKSEPSKYNYTE